MITPLLHGPPTAMMHSFFSCLIVTFSLILTSVLASSSSSSPSNYYEQLNLKPLPQSNLLASFNFRSNTTLPQFEAHNFQYFPRSLGQILQHVGTRELHLRFALGRWDAESWGARPWDGTKEGGTGVELWAWLEAQTDEEYIRILSGNNPQGLRGANWGQSGQVTSG